MDNLMLNLSSMTWELAALFAVAGAVGGLLRHSLSRGGLVLPKVVTTADGEKLLRLGFLSSILCGAVVGMLVDHHWVTALSSGYAGPHMLEKILSRTPLVNGKYSDRGAEAARGSPPERG
jgi:hypothetical protein